MKDNRSGNALSALAESLFLTDKGGRVKLEYPILFMFLLVGLVFANIQIFILKDIETKYNCFKTENYEEYLERTWLFIEVC